MLELQYLIKNPRSSNMERNDIPIPYSGNAVRKSNQVTSKYPIGYFKDKPCKECSKPFTPTAPSELHCSDNCRDEALADSYLMRNYGITINSYRDLYILQDGKCKICNEDGLRRSAAANSDVGLTVDHDHTTGNVRGLLCHTCNSALGQLQDSPTLLQNAINYLEADVPVFTDTITKPRSRVNDLSMDKHLEILEDRFDNQLNRKELSIKYDITEAKVRGVIELKTEQSKKAYKRYSLLKESATTIETRETEEVE